MVTAIKIWITSNHSIRVLSGVLSDSVHPTVDRPSAAICFHPNVDLPTVTSYVHPTVHLYTSHHVDSAVVPNYFASFASLRGTLASKNLLAAPLFPRPMPASDHLRYTPARSIAVLRNCDIRNCGSPLV